MCGHKWIRFDNIRACIRCGLIVTAKGEFVGFDKKLTNRFSKGGKNSNEK